MRDRETTYKKTQKLRERERIQERETQKERKTDRQTEKNNLSPPLNKHITGQRYIYYYQYY